MPQPTIQQVHIEAALSDLSVAWRQDRPSIAEMIFPRIVVGKKSDRYFVWNKGDWWRRNVAKRAPGTTFARTGIGLSNEPYNSEQYALEYPIPDEIQANADVAVDPAMTATEFLYDQHMLEQDFQFASQWMTTGSGWTAGTLGNGKWSATNSTPVKDIQNAVRTIRRSLGASMSHDIVALGGTIVETALLTNAEIVNKLVYVQTGTIDNLRAALAGILGLDEFIVADREYNTAAEGKTASYSPVIDDDLLIVARPRTPGLNTPSAGYSFCWDENGKGDMYIERYRQEEVKSDIIRSICYFDLKQVSNTLGVFFNDCAD